MISRLSMPSTKVRFAEPDRIVMRNLINDWNAETKPMHSLRGGHWLKETVLPPGTYEYSLVVDGEWMPDPRAWKTMPNPFGGRNSLLKVASSPEGCTLRTQNIYV